MNKLIKLVLVNLMGLFDYNGVSKEMESGVKGKSESRLLIIGLVSIVYGYLMYVVFNILGESLVNKDLLIFIGFVVATLMSFLVSVIQVGPIIFKSEDTEYLFSLPLSKHQIILSKVFNIYIRNIFFVFIILLSCIIAYVNYDKVNETMVLMYIINGLFVPFIPIILTVLIQYFNYYIKFNWKKIFSYLIKIVLVMLLCIGCYLLFKDINGNNINNIMEGIYERLRFIYPTLLFYVNSIVEENIMSFIIYVIINLVVIYVFMFFLLKNYMKICSLLKGIKSNSKFSYDKRISFGRKLGSLRKELLFIVNNKLYFNGSYSILCVISILLIMVCIFVSVDEVIKVNLFYEYYNLYIPFIMAGIIGFGNSCINSISLEKDNREMLCTLPVKMGHILFYKWLANVLICSLFIILDVSIVNIMFKPNLFVIIISYVVPLVVVMFISLLSIILDYRFVVKNENDDGVILKQRIISYIPSLLSLLIIFMPLLFKAYVLYKVIIFSFILMLLIGMLIFIFYLIINGKRLRKHLVN